MKLSGMSALLCACIAEAMLLGSVLAQEDALFIDQKKLGVESLATNIIGYVRDTTGTLLTSGVWYPVVEHNFMGYTILRPDSASSSQRVRISPNAVTFLTVAQYDKFLADQRVWAADQAARQEASRKAEQLAQQLAKQLDEQRRQLDEQRRQEQVVAELKRQESEKAAERKRKAFEEVQTAKGLVLYDGQWLTQAEAKERAAKANQVQANISIISTVLQITNLNTFDWETQLTVSINSHYRYDVPRRYRVVKSGEAITIDLGKFTEFLNAKNNFDPSTATVTDVIVSLAGHDSVAFNVKQ